MRFTVIAPFHGRLQLIPDDSGHMKAMRGDLQVELRTTRPVKHPGMAVLVNEIAMTTRVPPDQLDQFIAEVGEEPVQGGVLATLKERLINELQTFESGYAAAFGEEHVLFRIAWEHWIEEFTPESPEEEQKLRINRIGAIRPPRELGALVEIRHLQYYFARADRYADLNIPLAFFREGMNSLEADRYVTAFHSFYFIIEDFFAGGRFKENEVLREFHKSTLMTQVLQEVIDLLANEPEHGAPFQAMFSDEKLSVDIDGFMQLLFNLRGHLHHYSRGGRKPRGTPFNQAHFKIAALAVQMITGLALKLKMIEIDKNVDPHSPPGINWGRLLS